jgi:hypothetical protein
MATSATAILAGRGWLYALDPSWDSVLSIKTSRSIGGRSATFRRITCISDAGFVPSQTKLLQRIDSNFTACTGGGTGLETDKLNSELIYSGGSLYKIVFQSSSNGTARFSNITVTNDPEHIEQ